MFGNNPRKLLIYVIFDGELGVDGQPIDFFGTLIEIEKEKERILFRSAGPNGTFERNSDSDDIQLTWYNQTSEVATP
ncbi:MAG: hypothetical protein AAF546_09350 [Verrucomicrobiota bacterium]